MMEEDGIALFLTEAPFVYAPQPLDPPARLQETGVESYMEMFRLKLNPENQPFVWQGATDTAPAALIETSPQLPEHTPVIEVLELDAAAAYPQPESTTTDTEATPDHPVWSTSDTTTGYTITFEQALLALPGPDAAPPPEPPDLPWKLAPDLSLTQQQMLIPYQQAGIWQPEASYLSDCEECVPIMSGLDGTGQNKLLIYEGDGEIPLPLPDHTWALIVPLQLAINRAGRVANRSPDYRPALLPESVAEVVC